MMMTGRYYGIDFESPLLDDRVVEAVLSVRYEERDTPTEWKPLMKSAMEGLLPGEYLRRTNKIGAGPQPVRGYSTHFQSLRRLWEYSGLLDNGLFDSNALLESAAPK
ncbi:asparagine synthase-related protein, partial [Brevibacterium luteolum]|uniref:asparagine synthase-related protein n=3 Tax=Brevibacterium TaxID=1696 RepID=UPI0021B08253